jgi:hypothetical protein
MRGGATKSAMGLGRDRTIMHSSGSSCFTGPSSQVGPPGVGVGAWPEKVMWLWSFLLGQVDRMEAQRRDEEENKERARDRKRQKQLMKDNLPQVRPHTTPPGPWEAERPRVLCEVVNA